MHSRELLPHERALAEGIAGEIRNLVTVWRSARGPDMQYDPVIEATTDSFGNSSTADDFIATRTGLRLQVGDTVSFSCRGRDPQGRVLRWTVSKTGHVSTRTPSVEGAEVELSWVVTEQDVIEMLYLEITLFASGRYHRYGNYDDQRRFKYAVDPPLKQGGLG